MSHRIFTDNTEEQAVEQYETKYDNTNNQKNPNNVVIRMKQQYNISTNRAASRKSTIMSVDDSLLFGPAKQKVRHQHKLDR